MKFQCDRCKTRYSIADEKVRGKILKIRCKNCAAVITVREEGAVVPRQGAEVSRSGPVLAAAAAPPRAGRGTIELRTIAPPAPLAGAPADEGEPTRIQDPAVAPPVDDWYLATEGEQEGPISLEQARDKVAKKRPEDEMHAWREDFEAWLPIDKVPALAPFLPVERRQPPPLPPPLGQPPPRAGVSLPPPVSLLPAAPIVEDEPDEHDPFAAVPGARMVAAAPPSADDGMDFNIGEASRVVKMPLIARGGGDEIPQEKPRKKQSLPGVGRGTGAAPVVPSNGSPRPDVSAAHFGASVAPERRRSGLVFWILGGVVAAGLGTIFLVISSSGSAREPEPNETKKGGSRFADNYYENQEKRPTAPAPAPTPPPAPVADAPKPKPVAPKPRPTPTAGQTPAPVAPTPASGGGKVDTFAEEERGSGSLSVDDIRNAYLANEVVIKRCYERALKQDPGLGVTKIVVTLTVAPSGIVDRVAVPQQSSALGACVTQSIRSWRFRKTASEFTTEFPILFAKRG